MSGHSPSCFPSSEINSEGGSLGDVGQESSEIGRLASARLTRFFLHPLSLFPLSLLLSFLPFFLCFFHRPTRVERLFKFNPSSILRLLRFFPSPLSLPRTIRSLIVSLGGRGRCTNPCSGMIPAELARTTFFNFRFRARVSRRLCLGFTSLWKSALEEDLDSKEWRFILEQEVCFKVQDSSVEGFWASF